MDIILDYHTGLPKTVLTVEEGETPRQAIRRQFGHENEFLFVGGNFPPDMDIPVKTEVIPIEGSSSGSDQPVEVAPRRTRTRKSSISKD